MKSWYSQSPNYIIDLSNWSNYNDTTLYPDPKQDFPQVTPLKTEITIYDLSQVLLCVILFLHQYMVMFVARESALIFIDEKKNSQMSEMLRRRNLHISDYVPNASKAVDDASANKPKEEEVKRSSAVGDG